MLLLLLLLVLLLLLLLLTHRLVVNGATPTGHWSAILYPYAGSGSAGQRVAPGSGQRQAAEQGDRHTDKATTITPPTTAPRSEGDGERKKGERKGEEEREA